MQGVVYRESWQQSVKLSVFVGNAFVCLQKEIPFASVDGTWELNALRLGKRKKVKKFNPFFTPFYMKMLIRFTRYTLKNVSRRSASLGRTSYREITGVQPWFGFKNDVYWLRLIGLLCFFHVKVTNPLHLGYNQN